MPYSLEVSTSLREIWDLKSHAPEKIVRLCKCMGHGLFLPHWVTCDE